jgi:hypothetical protein
LQDLYSPEPKRTRKHLNALFNFIRFIEYKKGMVAELSEEKHAARDSVKELRRDLQEAEAELADKQQAHAAHQHVRFCIRMACR